MKKISANIYLLLSSSVIFIFYSFMALETKWNSILTVNIPLCREFPIPVLFWLGVFAYLGLISAILKINYKSVLRFSLLLGFFVSFIFTLSNINIRNVKGEVGWFSGAYALYFKFIFYLALTVLSVWSGILSRLFPLGGSVYAYPGLICSIPLLFIYSCIVLFFCHNYAFLFFAGILFLITFYLRGKEGLYAGVKRAIGALSRVFSNEKVFLTCIFIIALVFRIFLLKRTMTNPGYIDTGADGRTLDTLARDFLAGKPASFPGSRGYWMFLAGIYAIFGDDYFKVGLIQSIFGVLAIIMIYAIAKKGFGVVTARIAAIIAALDYPLIFSAISIGHEAMDIFYVAFAAYLLVKVRDMGINIKSTCLAALIGLICAIAMVTREANALMPIIAIVWLIYVFSKLDYPRAKRAVTYFVLLLFTIIGIAPFLYLNFKSRGSLYDQSSPYGAASILQNYNPYLTGIGFDPIRDFHGSIKIVLDKPLIFLKALWSNYYAKFMELYFNQGYGGFDPIFLVRKPMTNYYLIMWFYAYLLTFFGMISVLTAKIKGRPIAYLVLLMILYKTLFYLFTITQYRYRAAIEPFLIILVAYGIYRVIRFSRPKQGLKG